ncbi:MAG TPA: hypothetical protein PKE64_10380 [Anaerolineae bacterium]|nr:hypothetical protein [Anaerolineae bacterium]HMR64405.1 hypothetical protein [Anaerolineae bacterium]
MRVISGRFGYAQPARPALAWPVGRVDGALWLTGLSLFGLLVALLATIQFATPGLVGNDGYYHIKLAQIMGQEGLRPNFPWLPLSVLNPAAYVDHHFLYHVLLIPFTYVDLRVGAKWASVVLPALTFLAGWLLLRAQQVPYAAGWTLGFLAISEAFLFRMSMPRAQAVSLLFLLLALHLSLSRRYRWLLPLGMLYVWLYNAFPLLLLVVGAHVVMQGVLDRRFEPQPVLYAGVGLGLGLIINPYFPQNLLFIYHHLFPKLTDMTAVSVGNEWYPYETWTLVENSGPALLVFVAGAFALGLRERRLDPATATMFALAVIFGLMLFKSRRFVEYYPAFALLFCALAWKPVLQAWLAPGRQGFARLVPVGLALLLTASVYSTVSAARESVAGSGDDRQYEAASTWLKSQTPAGSRIFQTDWDDFPRLFYHNTHNTYLIGLDPTYMQIYDAQLYADWVDLTQGQIESPGRDIATKFGADYVLTDLAHEAFLEQAQADPQLKEVYRDHDAVIFQVVR